MAQRWLTVASLIFLFALPLPAQTSAAPKFSLTVGASPPAGGTVKGGGNFAAGSVRTVTAAVKPGYTFSNWVDNGAIVSGSPSYTLVLDQNHALVANFSPMICTVKVAAAAGGSAAGATSAPYGARVTVTAAPGPGYTFYRWTENGRTVSSAASYGFVVKGSRNLVANFKPQTFKISVAAAPAGKGTVAGTGTYAYGVTRSVSATPKAGLAFLGWRENGALVSASPNYTFVVTRPRNLVANFGPPLPPPPPPQVDEPDISLTPGATLATVTANAATSTPGAIIRYTTDGSEPAASSPSSASGVFTVKVGITLKAKAVKSGMRDSATASLAIPDSSAGLLASGNLHWTGVIYPNGEAAATSPEIFPRGGRIVQGVSGGNSTLFIVFVGTDKATVEAIWRAELEGFAWDGNATLPAAFASGGNLALLTSADPTDDGGLPITAFALRTGTAPIFRPAGYAQADVFAYSGNSSIDSVGQVLHFGNDTATLTDQASISEEDFIGTREAGSISTLNGGTLTIGGGATYGGGVFNSGNVVISGGAVSLNPSGNLTITGSGNLSLTGNLQMSWAQQDLAGMFSFGSVNTLVLSDKTISGFLGSGVLSLPGSLRGGLDITSAAARNAATYIIESANFDDAVEAKLLANLANARLSLDLATAQYYATASRRGGGASTMEKIITALAAAVDNGSAHVNVTASNGEGSATIQIIQKFPGLTPDAVSTLQIGP